MKSLGTDATSAEISYRIPLAFVQEKDIILFWIYLTTVVTAKKECLLILVEVMEQKGQ